MAAVTLPKRNLFGNWDIIYLSWKGLCKPLYIKLLYLVQNWLRNGTANCFFSPHCDTGVDEGEAGGIHAGGQLAAVILELLHCEWGIPYLALIYKVVKKSIRNSLENRGIAGLLMGHQLHFGPNPVEPLTNYVGQRVPETWTAVCGCSVVSAAALTAPPTNLSVARSPTPERWPRPAFRL